MPRSTPSTTAQRTASREPRSCRSAPARRCLAVLMSRIASTTRQTSRVTIRRISCTGWPVKGGCIRYGLPTSLTCSCGAPPISVLGCTASIIVLRLSPERGEWLLWLPQDENGSVVLKVHTYGAGRSGGQCHRVVRLRSVLRRDIDRDEHLTTTSIWSPEIKGVVPADRRWQM